jgi:copper chaperone CopZ
MIKLFVKSVMMLFITFALTINAEAQENLNKTDTVKIYGNCGMCKKTIEKAANSDGVARVDWNKETKMATISYDSKKTNLDEILKRIANAGYDSDNFTAPDKAYNNLHGCCQYDRPKKN